MAAFLGIVAIIGLRISLGVVENMGFLLFGYNVVFMVVVRVVFITLRFSILGPGDDGGLYSFGLSTCTVIGGLFMLKTVGTSGSSSDE